MDRTLWDHYDRAYPEERGKTELCRAFLCGTGGLSAEHRRGHFTGSAWILNGDRTRAVLLRHGKLGVWLQPGGHLEPGETPLEGALREAREETGLSLKVLDESLFDLDIHPIPARGEKEAHYHYDLRFLFEADDSRPLVLSSESDDLRWVSLGEIPRFSRWESVWRLVLKSTPWTDSPVFGELEEGAEYGERTGAYALITDGQGLVAVMKTPRGYFLPGGGMEEGETGEECLIRELAEEAGWTVVPGPRLGSGTLFGFAPSCGRHMGMTGHYYRAVITGKVPGTEGDHETLWLTPGEAKGKLRLPHQAWAVEKYLMPRGMGI